METQWILTIPNNSRQKDVYISEMLLGEKSMKAINAHEHILQV